MSIWGSANWFRNLTSSTWWRYLGEKGVKLSTVCINIIEVPKTWPKLKTRASCFQLFHFHPVIVGNPCFQMRSDYLANINQQNHIITVAFPAIQLRAWVFSYCNPFPSLLFSLPTVFLLFIKYVLQNHNTIIGVCMIWKCFWMFFVTPRKYMENQNKSTHLSNWLGSLLILDTMSFNIWLWK